MASSDPKTVSPTLSFPPRRGYLRQEPLAPSQSVLRTMLWRVACCHSQVWDKTPLAKLRLPFPAAFVALVDFGCPPFLGIHHTCAHPAIWLFATQPWDKSISTFAWPSLLSSWGKQRGFGRIMHTLQKYQTVRLLPWDPAGEDQNSTGLAGPVLLHSALVWSTHRDSAKPLLPQGSTGRYCML